MLAGTHNNLYSLVLRGEVKGTRATLRGTSKLYKSACLCLIYLRWKGLSKNAATLHDFAEKQRLEQGERKRKRIHLPGAYVDDLDDD